MTRMFSSEREMTNAFLQSEQLYSYLKYSDWIRQQDYEVTGLFGIPDIVITFGKVLPVKQNVIRVFAFELKLRNWKRALSQAFKYSAFAHFSYVVLDDAHTQPSLQNIHLFEKANIGLISVNANREITLFHSPYIQKPYSAQLYQDYYSSLSENIFGEASAII